jgi:hypothetical protein
MVPFADVSNTRGVSKSRGYDGAPAGKTNAGPCRKPHLAGGSPRIGRCCCSKRGNFSGSLVGRLSIYFGRGQRSRQKFGHCGSKLTFCGGLLLRDFRSASSTTWYSLASIGCFQRFAMRGFRGNSAETIGPISKIRMMPTGIAILTNARWDVGSNQERPTKAQSRNSYRRKIALERIEIAWHRARRRSRAESSRSKPERRY